MNEQELVGRLIQAAGSLRPSAQASAEDLTKARKRLASCLLRGQTEDVLPPVGYRFADPDRSSKQRLSMVKPDRSRTALPIGTRPTSLVDWLR